MDNNTASRITAVLSDEDIQLFDSTSREDEQDYLSQDEALRMRTVKSYQFCQTCGKV